MVLLEVSTDIVFCDIVVLIFNDNIANKCAKYCHIFIGLVFLEVATDIVVLRSEEHNMNMLARAYKKKPLTRKKQNVLEIWRAFTGATYSR